MFQCCISFITGVLQVCHRSVKIMLLDFTRLLQGCYNGVTGCYRSYRGYRGCRSSIGILQGC